MSSGYSAGNRRPAGGRTDAFMPEDGRQGRRIVLVVELRQWSQEGVSGSGPAVRDIR